MTLAEFRKLKPRDFGNGAVLDEIEVALEQRDNAVTLLCRMCAHAHSNWETREGLREKAVDWLRRHDLSSVTFAKG